MKAKLIEKLMEHINDLEVQEQLELVGLDIYEIVEAAIEQRLSTMTDEQILELI